ncbi:MAG: hypothetical protein IIZ50_07070 [Bifidobacterium sp.]|nr:hypothetical protein [Bifidobacterium sp.]RYP95268.1 polysaccharide biosynthesis protein [Bifidobacterium pseudolongum subsp. globosum]
MNALRKMELDLRVGIRYSAVNLARLVLQSVVSMDNHMLGRLNHTRVRLMERWFAREFGGLLTKWKDVSESAQPFADAHEAPIWMMWLQGTNELPEIAKPFVDSIRRQNPNLDVRIVDLEQIRALVDIPPIIEQRYREGALTGAHLSDYLRFLLLEGYGGVWMDLSLYETAPIPIDRVLAVPFWSVKGIEPYPFAAAIPDGLNWQVYAMAAQPHALFNRVMLALTEEYWTRFGTRIDYFLTYYLAKLARSVPAVDRSYTSVPANNVMCEQPMVWVLGQSPLNEHTLVEHCRDSGTWLYKTNLHESKHDLDRFLAVMRQLN